VRYRLRIDEVKEIRDRARALEVYAAQALNMDAERQAIEIRIGAERRAGEMLSEMKKTGERDSGRGNRKAASGATSPPPKLADLGISRDQSAEWQQLAVVPDEIFEKALADKASMPSREKILAANRENGILEDGGKLGRGLRPN
jgi:hypothetical protein